MILELLANATTADPMISGNWLTTFSVAVIGAVAAAWQRQVGRKEAQATRLESPVPEVPTRKVFTPPSYDAHRALCDRVQRVEDDMRNLHDEVKAVKDAQGEQFRQLMVAGGEREIRISEKIEGFARAIHNRIDEYLKPPTGRRG